jgi:plastocyanin
MRPHTILCALLVAAGAAPPLRAQQVTERTPNLSGGWVGTPGTLSFHFTHRFNHSGAPARQVQNRPTFLLAAALPLNSMIGVNYATRSALVEGVPNEWELFVRSRLPAAAGFGIVDAALQAGYNEAARSVDAELMLSGNDGAARPLLAVRWLSSAAGGASAFAVAAGAILRIGEHAAVAADIGQRPGADDDAIFWGAGLQLRLAGTPHSLSLHATNTDALTLQSSSHAAGVVRWGFEFTVPLTPARLLGRTPRPAAAAQPAGAAAASVRMAGTRFSPARLSIAAGQIVEWTNDDVRMHTVTAADGSWDSGELLPGAVWRRRFDDPGTVLIVCTPHPGMRMEVVVE